MVFFGYPTNPSKEILGEIRKAKRLGMDFVEIGFEGPCGLPEIILEKRKRILDLLKKQHIFSIEHTAYWMNFGSLYPAIRKAWIAEAKRTIRIAAKLGMNMVNLHASSQGMFMIERDGRLVTKEGKQTVLKNYVKSMKELVSYARKHDVRLMLENCPKGKEISEVADIKYILDRVPGLKFHLDIGHANTVGGTPVIVKFINTFKDKLIHIHIHDNNGKKDEHLPIGEGNIDFRKVVYALKKAGFDRTISFEVFFGGEKKFRDSVNRIKKLWKEV